MSSTRTATITKVTPKWVRTNGTLRPEPPDSKTGPVYDTPLGAFRIDSADRVSSAT